MSNSNTSASRIQQSQNSHNTSKQRIDANTSQMSAFKHPDAEITMSNILAVNQALRYYSTVFNRFETFFGNNHIDSQLEPRTIR